MTTLYGVFDSIGQSIHIVYCVALVIAVYKYREINSTVICIAVLCVMEQIMTWLSGPLFALNSWEAWYGGWIALNAILIVVLYEAHKVLKVNLAKLVNTVALAQIICASIQVIRYIERCFFQGDRLDPWYPVAINSVNVSVAIIVVFTLIREKEEKRVGLYI